MVTGIDTGSPAAAASLGYRDLAYYMDNVSVQSAGAFCDVLGSRKTGDKIRGDFTRTYSDGSSKDFFADVTLQEGRGPLIQFEAAQLGGLAAHGRSRPSDKGFLRRQLGD